ncbi:hypothetical protein TUBRATIS_27210 [Tubulinosema ratisbonensis]|uniref:USP domain-containing protein n=1 Tax=Tubulinosema ratisbonensis TaxID=291195 RepID=A0A437AIF5_9MICR|nr:hypothetical protein TUBRATIS_27210 [Tubulinosema ratisbonensis]
MSSTNSLRNVVILFIILTIAIAFLVIGVMHIKKRNLAAVQSNQPTKPLKGNYCFMASSLGLFTDEINCFKSIDYVSKENIVRILRDIHKPNKSFSDFYEDFDKIISDLKSSEIISGRQNDASEFLAVLFDRISENLLKQGKLQDNDWVRKFCFVLHNLENNKPELSPYISDQGTNGIRKENDLSVITIETNELFPLKEVHQTPEILIYIITLETEDNVIKHIQDIFEISNANQYKAVINISGTPNTEVYTLKGAAVHMGSDANSGHYNYFHKKKEGNSVKWMRYSDNKLVKEITNVPSSAPFPCILVYEKEKNK